jgi:hypothetical protein
LLRRGRVQVLGFIGRNLRRLAEIRTWPYF